MWIFQKLAKAWDVLRAAPLGSILAFFVFGLRSRGRPHKERDCVAMYPSCETCHALSNALANVNERLASATAKVRTLAGIGKPEEFYAPLFQDLESLAMESQGLRAELERHITEHGEMPKKE
jgi:hypothetical protein